MADTSKEPAASYDVIVAGSGIAGVSAALAAAEAGLSVAIFEKDDLIGGGTGLSYGGIWVGCNHLAKAAKIPDTRQAVLDYMKFVAGDCAEEKLMHTFVDQSPLAAEFFDRCGIKFQLTSGLADHYYPVAPGSTENGRSFEPQPISVNELGNLGPKIRDSFIDPRIMTVEEFSSWGGVVKALIKRDVPIYLDTPVEGLVRGEHGVGGVRIRGGRVVKADKGVVLATGGWEGDSTLAHEFEGVPEACSPFPRAVSGDGWKIAVEMGASTALIRNNLAIMLGFHVPLEAGGKEPEFRLAQIMECQCPHTIIVNSHGERFSDESYFQDTVQALRQYDIWRREYRNSPSYLIFDSQYVDGFSFAGAPIGAKPPDWVSRADNVKDLARKLGIDADNLEKTVERFNGFAREGVDHDFHRGEKRWNLSHRDAIKGGNPLNRRLGPLERSPFYGVRLYPGVFVSSGGVRTNTHGQVVDTQGNGIPKLYAVGNTAAHLEYGIGYQAGFSLASGMTFGYLAVRHIITAN